MNCEFIKNNLFAIAEKQLSDEEYNAALAHAAGCGDCSSRLASFMSLMDVIDKEKSSQPNPFLTARILQKMESHGVSEGRGIFVRLPAVLQPVFAVALIMLAILTGFLAGKQGRNRGEGAAFKNDLSVMKSDLFITELNDEDKTVELYK
ncbi:MAG: hypothetical protein WCO02_01285 [Bacteroidota bacterium]